MAIHLAAGGMAIARPADDGAPAFGRSSILIANVREGTELGSYTDQLVRRFALVAAGPDGLDSSDLARIEEQALARRSAQYEQQLAKIREDITRGDKDGDGRLSLAELVDASGAGKERARQSIERQFARQDGDRNGFLTAAELAGRAPTSADRSDIARRSRLARLLQIDPDRDGFLTTAELQREIATQFALIDSDGDGRVSAAEFAAAESLVSQAREATSLPYCSLPRPGAGTAAYAIHAGGGQVLSTLQLAGVEREVGVIDVLIENGKQPLYLMLSSLDPAIWRIAGAAHRVEHMVIFSGEKDKDGKALAGVIGVDRERTVFAEPDCIKLHQIGQSGGGAISSPMLHFAASAQPAERAAARIGKVASVTFPSLKVSEKRGWVPAPPGFDADEWFVGTADYPLGLTKVDAARVIAPGSVAEFDVMPGQFGVARLTAQGVLVPTVHYQEYRIARPLPRFPAQAGNGLAVNYVLAQGVKMPAGEPGGACVYSDAGTLIVEGSFCRRSLRDDAVQVRVDANGEACLYRGGVRREACFPKDGRPLVPKGPGGSFVAAEAAMAETAPPPQAAASSVPRSRSAVEIIPSP